MIYNVIVCIQICKGAGSIFIRHNGIANHLGSIAGNATLSMLTGESISASQTMMPTWAMSFGKVSSKSKCTLSPFKLSKIPFA